MQRSSLPGAAGFLAMFVLAVALIGSAGAMGVGTANVDGVISPGEWITDPSAIPNDYIATLYRSGQIDNPGPEDILGYAYMRYQNGIAYLLVVPKEGLGVITNDPGTAFVKYLDSRGREQKYFDDQTGDNDSPPDFAWIGPQWSDTYTVGPNAGKPVTLAHGFEASFAYTLGTTIYIHCNVFEGGDSQTASTDKDEYYGVPFIDVEKYVSVDGGLTWVDADSAPGAALPDGVNPRFKIVITNTGSTALTDVDVTDTVFGTINLDGTLAIGGSAEYLKTGTWSAEQHTNVATAIAKYTYPNTGETVTVTDSDAANCKGTPAPGIDVEKYVSVDGGATWEDADTPTGPYASSGAPVQFKFWIKNTGNVALTGITLSDSDFSLPAEANIPASLAAQTISEYIFTGATWQPGQHTNTATATGSYGGTSYSDSDDANYFGATPEIDVEKYVSGDGGATWEDADALTGPYLASGTSPQFKFVVKNTGNVELSNIALTDSDFDVRGITIPETLAAGMSFEGTITAAWAAGQHTNTATASGSFGTQTDTDTDDANYFGSSPAIAIEKLANGQDGAFIAAGTPITWTYTVTNTGNVPLTDVAVTDDKGVVVSLPKTTLAVGESMTGTGTGTAVAGQYNNIGTVTGTSPTGATVTDDDPSSYFGTQPSISIVKYTNGDDANAAPGPYVKVGDPVTWTYVVTNTGNVELTNVVVTDDQGVTVTAPKTVLQPGEGMTATATGTAVAGQYANIGTVTGTPPVGTSVTAQDPSHYFGSAPAIAISKLTNGADGQYIRAGAPITWTYDVTNTGNVELTNIVVTDNRGVAVTLPKTSLAIGETMQGTATGTAVADQYDNVGTVTGTPPVGPAVTASDPSSYFGGQPGLTIEKLTNGQDGATIPVGTAITWTYKVTNTGNVELTNIGVTDDIVGEIGTIPSLAPGDSVTLSKEGIAVPGAYNNIGTATTTYDGVEIKDDDPSSYYGSQPEIAIIKTTNGADGLFIPVWADVTWTYEVKNTGNVDLTDVVVTDDKFPGETIGTIATLAAGASQTVTKTGTAGVGQYDNIGTVTGKPPVGNAVTASDPSSYFGTSPAIAIEKFTNGEDGAFIPVGTPITWTYNVINLGNVPLTNVVVTDNRGVTVTAPKTTLAVGERWTATATGTAVAGHYDNIGTVTGTSPDGSQRTASDPSSYFGSQPSIAINKVTNGADGQYIAVGDPITWTYTITNTGNVPLTNVVVTDDQGVTVSLPKTTLAVGESMIGTAQGTAVAGAYKNTGTVTGKPPVGDDVTATDDSSYFGGAPGIQIVKLTNGMDGAYFPVGTSITWTYDVTNTGNVELTNIVVTDNKGVTVTLPKTTLGVGQSMQGIATGTAGAGLYENIGTVTGTPPVGSSVTASDASSYFGSAPALTLEKTGTFDAGTNGVADPGEIITYEFTVTNAGNVPLTGITVTDPKVGPITCPKDTLAPGESMIGTATYAVTQADIDAGSVYNIATADSKETPPVTDDTTVPLPQNPALTIEKLTNGADGATIPVGTPITWTYKVTNTGNVVLTSIVVIDDKFPGETIGTIDTLAVGASQTLEKTGTASAGTYSNTGTATTTYGGSEVKDDDGSSYFGGQAGLTIEKLTNGEDGATIPVGSPITWTYKVTNTGNVELTNIIVTDSKFPGETIGTIDSLAPKASQTVTKTGTAIAGTYENTGTATTTYGGTEVKDDDDSSYFGGAAALTIEKLTNGADGATIPVGAPITWTYKVTNTGNVDLTNIVVTDDKFADPIGTIDSLAVGASKTLEKTGIAVAGAYSNTGTATTAYGGTEIKDDDGSSYYGGQAELEIVKLTNGEDGATIPVGATVTWTYKVTNTGNVELTNIVVTDDKFADPIGTIDTLAIGASITLEKTGIAVAGAYSNTGTATTTYSGTEVKDDDGSSYYGGQAGLEIVKLTNGEDGATIPVGSPITWTYKVTNTGNVELTNIVVTDDKFADPVGTIDSLAVGASKTLEKAGTAVAGAYSNMGTATTTYGGKEVTDDDGSSYYGGQAGIEITKQVGTSASGPWSETVAVETGQDVYYQIHIKNTGNTVLNDVALTDDPAFPADVAFSDPVPTTLASGQELTTVVGPIKAGSSGVADTATIKGTPTVGDPVSADDGAAYTILSPAITIDKVTSGLIDGVEQKGDGLSFDEGTALTWIYTVTNPDDVPLSGVAVKDDAGTPSDATDDLTATLASGDTNGDGKLDPSETWVFKATGTAVATALGEDYHNWATVQGTTPAGGTVTAKDDSYYTGIQLAEDAAIQVVKDVSLSATGPWTDSVTAVVNQKIYYRFVITNTGKVLLHDITLADDLYTSAVFDPALSTAGTLDPGESFTTYYGSVTAVAGTHPDTATATGTTPRGTTIEDSDGASYFAAGGMLLPTQTTVQMYASGQWPAVYSAFTYVLKGGKISSISPGVIFYYNGITAPSTAFTLTVTETNSQGWKPMLAQTSGKNLQAFLYDANFNIVSTGAASGTNPYTVTFNVKGATSGGTYYIGVKYAPDNLKGIVPTGGTSEYSFRTAIGGTTLTGSEASIPVQLK